MSVLLQEANKITLPHSTPKRNRKMRIVLVFLGFLSLGNARAEEGHTHEGALGKFYSSWMMPDAPNVSCCHEMDCKPAASKFENGHWSARWKDDQDWIDIPASKVEQNRDSPDGRSHLCGRRSLSEFTVFCFARGGGA